MTTTAALANDAIVADTSAPYVSVTTGFSGTDITVFGAIDVPSALAITVSGPQSQMTLRKKTRLFGFWVDKDSVTFTGIPSYFALATTALPDADIDKNQAFIASLDIGQRAPDIKSGKFAFALPFYQSLLNQQKERALYSVTPGSIKVLSGKLFHATFTLPANTPLGDYSVRIYSFANGAVISETMLPVKVREDGLSASIFEAAQSRPLSYITMTLLLSIVIGGGSSLLFQRIRGTI
jgi:uncharacterized protein (TIGR02186 family)